jgi:SSS family transporter
MTRVRRFSLLVVSFLILPLGAFASERAGNLVSIQPGTITPLGAEDPISRVFTVGGRLVGLGSASTWMLDEKREEWRQSSWRPQSPVLAVAGDETRTFLLLGSESGGALTGVEIVSLDGNALASTQLTALPVSLSSANAAVLGTTLYIAGFAAGGEPQLLAIDPSAVEPQWVNHGGWPGSGGGITSVVGQTFAVFVTLQGVAGHGDRLLRWKAGEGWSEKTALPGTVIEGGARDIGQAHVLYLLRSVANEDSAPRLQSFHTITGSMATLDDPKAAAARSVTAWNDGFLWERPAADGGGSEFAFAVVESTRHLLHWLDWIVIVVYLVSMLGMGLYFYLREKRNSTADFFVGGRTIPFWAAGISLYAANTSSISYIAIPAKAFETNWQYLTNNLVAVVGLTFVAVWIVPLLRRLNLMSVFQYLETRFHSVIRTLASALFMAVQIGSRMSVILFLPSLAIATITGIDVTWSILIMGVFTMIYTALGGMKAVVWTDIVQLVVKMGGIVFAVSFIVFMLDGGSGELFAIAAAEEKMKLLDWSFDLTKATIWGFIFLVLFDVVLTFPKDQVLMQRVLSTKSDKEAGRAVWTFAAVMIPGGFMFYFVGTALYAFYKTHPERMNPLLSIDATFPLFIAAELPMGIKGLIIAGILAAAMATLSSIMNSVATLASVDFYEKLVKKPNPKVSVRFAEAMTIVTGLLGMGVALVLTRYDIHSLFDISIELAGLLGGGFAGAYTLGMFTRRANWQGVTIGVAVSITVTTLAWTMNLVHPYFYLAISILVCIVVGWLASWFFPAPTRESLVGLTIHRQD